MFKMILSCSTLRMDVGQKQGSYKGEDGSLELK